MAAKEKAEKRNKQCIEIKPQRASESETSWRKAAAISANQLAANERRKAAEKKKLASQ